MKRKRIKRAIHTTKSYGISSFDRYKSRCIYKLKKNVIHCNFCVEKYAILNTDDPFVRHLLEDAVEFQNDRIKCGIVINIEKYFEENNKYFNVAS